MIVVCCGLLLSVVQLFIAIRASLLLCVSLVVRLWFVVRLFFVRCLFVVHLLFVVVRCCSLLSDVDCRLMCVVFCLSFV